ncbi:unnamed protein product [Plutella xylostella]|uniref:(diamondback moth) hypothetical protein n=1 Tax=Plutella xylostella TaxID=51655 RepID=A0A8S4DIG5_PLUXY|nr:unnamed protein product [Plutella xylostella]
MAFNPFLSMGEPAAAAPVTPEALNPFMMGDADPGAFGGAEDFTGDNPFAASNPFSDFGGGAFEPPAGDTVPVDIFGNGSPAPPAAAAGPFDGFMSAAAAPMDIFGSHEPPPRPPKPTELELVSTTADPPEERGPPRPPPPARPLPPETQTLIHSVTGHMELTTSHLLDRIPPTRTPSPVSLRDIHSPSPTPEPDIDELPPSETFDINCNKPQRPPPARPPLPPVARPPPPRPAPPPIPPPITKPQVPPPPQQHQAAEDINLFDAPVPVANKPTKEDIMSLYSAPKKEVKPVDFLSDDFMDDIPPATSEPQPSIAPVQPSSIFTSSAEPVGTIIDHVTTTTSGGVTSETSPTPLFSQNSPAEPSLVETAPALAMDVDSVAPMDCTEPPTEVPTAVTSPFAENDFETHKIDEDMKNPFEDSSAGFDTANVAAAPETAAPFQDNSADNFGSTQPSNIFGVPQDNAFAESDGFGEEDDTFDTMQTGGFGAQSSPFAASNAFESSQTNFFGANTASQVPASTADWGATPEPMAHDARPFPESQDAFDAFSAKFDNTTANHVSSGAWGDDSSAEIPASGFDADGDSDPFLAMSAPPPPPAATPRLQSQGSQDSGDDNFSLFIRPKEIDIGGTGAAVPALAPPPRPQALPESPRANPFDKSAEQQQLRFEAPQETRERSGSQGSGGETPPTPLFDDDISQPLEDFPRTKYLGPGWEMHLRQPNKKKITGQRFWKKVFVRLTFQGDNPVVQLLNTPNDKEPFQELPLQACYSVSEVGAQQFDQFGKIFTVKLQYVFYKERPGVRPGQVTKAGRITDKLSQFAAYAIQGDYQGVKEFGSDLRKLGLPVEHAPQVSQLFKIGSLNYEDVKQFSYCIEEALFRLPAHRDRALTYKMEEVQITAVDELYVEQDYDGAVQKQIARVRLFFLGFLSGMPDVEMGVNDLRRQGKEVVGRHDIIPVVTEEWIRVEDTEFHACVQPEEFTKCQIIKFKPPDACYIELMRFRVRPPKNRELPLQLKAVWCVTGNKVELRADVLVPGFASRKLGQIPCEDVCIRFPIPECWIYLFRVEKHFRYGSVKSAHRRTGKIKGIERFLGAVDTLSESLIEVTSGQAKYEHQHRAIVWRMPRLPKEGQGAYTTHNLVCRMALTSYDQIPQELAKFAYVEFTMPATQVSHMTVRSVSLQNYDSDPPEKYVRYLARHEYIVGIERTSGQDAPAYALVTKIEPKPEPPPPAAPVVPQPPSSDSDSD